LEYIKTIILHEIYDVFGEGLQALLSYNSRRMCMGFLARIIVKFKSGMCVCGGGGVWSEASMKVKNSGADFVIDCEEEYILTDDLALKDLLKY
jgi:hypothetical protein